MSKRMIALVFATVAVLAATPAAYAGEGAVERPAGALEQATAAGTGCGQAVDLLAGAGAAPAVTPAVAPAALEPVPMAPPFFTRTCRCSCGFPCKTDADCGPGGRCGAGITCC